MHALEDIIIVGLGSGIGGICRYLISLIIGSAGYSFPWGTFTVNVAGCLLIGALWGVTSRFQTVSPVFNYFSWQDSVVGSQHSYILKGRAGIISGK